MVNTLVINNQTDTQLNPVSQDISQIGQKIDSILLFWDEYERKRAYNEALELYSDLILEWQAIWYLKSALVYKKIGFFDVAISLLENAYSSYEDPVFLENIIIIHCENWNLIEAKKVYYQLFSLNRSQEGIQPFFTYSFIIENDIDLKKYEEIMINHLNENDFEIEPVLTKLSLVVSNYINSNLESINLSLKKYKNLEFWALSKENKEDFKTLYKRKLFLLQIWVTVLKDEIYLKEHLQDLEYLRFGNSFLKDEVLWEHFDENFSLFSQKNTQIDEEPTNTGFLVNDKFLEYLDHIFILHSNWLNYDVLVYLSSIIEKLSKNISIWNEEELYIILKMIKNEKDYIDTFSFELTNKYRNFLKEIDDLYWKYIRVFIQFIARDTEKYNTDEDYPQIIFTNPQLALLFCIEKLISTDFYSFTKWDFLLTLTKYGLEDNSQENLVLFSMLLYEEFFEYFIVLISNNKDLINNTFVIYYFLDAVSTWKTQTDQKTLSHIKTFLSQREQEQITDIEIWYIKMSYSILLYMEKWSIEDLVQNITEAEQNHSLEATIELANINLSNWIFVESALKFEEVYNKHPNINTLWKLIEVYLNKWYYNIALNYINLWIQLSYDMNYYLYSYHLNNWNFKNAFLLYIELTNNNWVPPLDIPIWTNQKLIDACDRFLYFDGKMNMENYELKLLSLHIWYSNDIKSTSEINLLSDMYISYILYLFNILLTITPKNIPQFVNNTIYNFFDTENKQYLLNLWVDSSVTNLEQTIIIMNYYFNSISNNLLDISKNIDNLEDMDKIEKLNNNLASLAYNLFSKIKWAEKYAYEWRTKIIFSIPESWFLIDEKKFWSKLIN